MRFLSAGLAVCAVLLIPIVAFPQGGPPSKEVEVINFPDPQNVVGSVEVTNLQTVGARFQLVGFTAAPLLGSEGPLEFTRACDAETPSSRWGTSAEVLESLDLPALSGEAWVRGAFVSGGGGNPMDVTGLTLTHSAFNCGLWSNPAGTGFTVSATGQFLPMPCSVPRPVACCAQVP